VPSSVLATGTVLAMIYGMKRFAEQGADATAGLAVLVSIAIGALFVRRQNRLAEPMIDLQLFRARLFTAALCVNIVGVFAAFGSFLFITQYLQLVLGMSPLQAGLWLAPAGLVFMAGSVLAPIVVRRFAPHTVLACGFLTAAAGYGLLTQVGVTGDLPVLTAAFLLFCAGLAPMGTLTTDLVMSAAPAEKAGAASGISETSFEFGAALGVAVLGSIVTAAYRTRMSEAGLQGFPAEAIDAARETLGAAVAAANTLEPDAGHTLLAMARDAFASSMQLSALVSALLAVIAAVVCARFMRRDPVPTG
jgi:DHA2 family multidrug resistance protein-like MFS transporter